MVRAAAKAGRAAETVRLLAVSKTFGAAAVRELAACGQLGRRKLPAGSTESSAARRPVSGVAFHRANPEQQDAGDRRKL
jgi:hypothetical protein